MADLNKALDVSLNAFKRYYNIKTEDVEAPFVAQADFISHNEQYYLIKAAKIADIDSNEYVYFACEENLSVDRLNDLCNIAWERGLSRVTPSYGHRNSDITLIILSDKILNDSFTMVKKIKKYKSYKHTFFGWSHFKLVAMDISLNRLTYNRQGQSLKNVFNNIQNFL